MIRRCPVIHVDLGPICWAVAPEYLLGGSRPLMRGDRNCVLEERWRTWAPLRIWVQSPVKDV